MAPSNKGGHGNSRARWDATARPPETCAASAARVSMIRLGRAAEALIGAQVLRAQQVAEERAASTEMLPRDMPKAPWISPEMLASKEKSADREGRKPAKEPAYEIAPPIRPASQVRAQIRIRLEAKLRHSSTAAS